jgi:hypothetical protein
MVAAIHEIVHGQHDLLFSLEVIWIESITAQNSPKLASVLYQSFWKFYIHALGLHCTAATSSSSCHYYSHSAFTRGNEPLLSKSCVHSQMFHDVEFCSVDIIPSIPPQHPYHFHCRNCISNAYWHILHL